MNSSPKYSVQALPGDDWEVRYTKTIVRTIVSLKEQLGITTEELAARCNLFLHEPDKIKTSTLNGLFAGKRKSISVPEVIMFAAALNTPVMSLISPPWVQGIEVRPGERMEAVRAMRTMIGVENLYRESSSNPLHMWVEPDGPHNDYKGQSTSDIVMHWAAEEALLVDMSTLLNSIEMGSDELILNARVEATRLALAEYHSWSDRLGRHALQPPELLDYLSWVPELDPKQFTLDFAREVLKRRNASSRGDG